MFEGIKKRIAISGLKKKLKKREEPAGVFNNFFSEANNILVMMPENQEEYNAALDFFNFLESTGRRPTVVLPEFRYNSLPGKDKITPVFVTGESRTRTGMPVPMLLEETGRRDYDITIDLNIEENLLYSALTALSGAAFRAGFNKPHGDIFYNFQIKPAGRENYRDSYLKLRNSLQMF